MAKEPIVCSNCGAPFHGLTACPEDAPRFVQAREDAKAVTVTFQTTAGDLEELVHIVHNVMMDIEESNGNDLDPQLVLLRAFVKQIEGKY